MKFITFLLTCLAFSVAFATENLVLSSGGTGKWRTSGGAKVELIDGKTNILVNGTGSASLRIPLQPEWKYLKLNVAIQTEKLVVGDLNWQNGRLAMRFYKGKDPVGAWPNVFGFSGDTPRKECARLYPIPEGATSLSLTPANFGKSGSVAFYDIRFEPIVDLKSYDQDAEPPAGWSETSLWSLDDAAREVNAFRESICLNGLWRFAPVADATVPTKGSGWGWFKVPGIWPKDAKSSQKFRMSIFTPPIDEAKLNTAWYRRSVSVPAGWQGRRIELEITMLQTCAKVFIDGNLAGEFYYPGGKLDLTKSLTPGKTHELALKVDAIPDATAKQEFMAPDRLVEVSNDLNSRGITGDMFLHSYPQGGHVTDALMIPLLSEKKLAIDAGLANVKPGKYFLEAEIRDGEQVETKFSSAPFTITSSDKSPRRLKFETPWVAPKLWDIDAPQNLYLADVRLKSASGETIDQLFPQEFGYREFRIEGKNFLLNGIPIHFRSLCTKNTFAGATECCNLRQANLARRAKEAGFNHLDSEEHSFAPGRVGYIDAVYREASRVGMLLTLTMPHAKNFNWNLDNPTEAERYRIYAESQIRRFQNLPGVVCYSMNHNATGYHGDQNPKKIDGIFSPDKYMEQGQPNLAKHRKQARIAEGIVRGIDSSRVIYHHESGNLGSVVTVNCYLDWAPRQERSDWIEEWEKHGVKPLLFIEWGMPHIASWSSYRGPKFIWRNSGVQCMWLNEYNAMVLGEEAYRSEARKIALYRKEDKICRGNQEVRYGTLRGGAHPDLYKVRAWTTSDNFRSLRARGITGLLPWDEASLWTLKAKAEPIAFDPLADLKKPGIVPDRFSTAGGQYTESFDEYVPSIAGEAALPAMQPEIAWIAGKLGDFTEKGHNFRPGETVHKSLMVLNDTRHPRTVECNWWISNLPAVTPHKAILKVDAGTRAESPVEFTIPPDTPAGELKLQAEFRFEDGKVTQDTLVINVIPPSPDLPKGRVGLFDPSGRSASTVDKLGLKAKPVTSQADLNGIDILVIGSNGLKKFPLQLSEKIRSGLKVLILEQDYPELTRVGFRGNIHGIRNVFSLDGSAMIRDWRGSSTLTPPSFETPALEITDPTWNWNGFSNTRVWRAGNRCNVNSVLLEKPCVGDFLPLYHGGFDLQYATALLWNQRVLLSQFDISDRTESDPEAIELLRTMLLKLDRIQPTASQKTYYAGDSRGKELLEQLGIRFSPAPTTLPDNGVLVIGPNAELTGVSEAVERGLSVLALGLDKTELEKHFPGKFQSNSGKFFSDYATGLTSEPEFAGISNAELHWRTELTMTAFDKDSVGGQALGIVRLGKGRIVATQITPWMFDENEMAFRTTRRRTQFLASRLLHNLGVESVSDGFELLDGVQYNGGALQLTSGWTGKADPKGEGRGAGWYKKEFKPDTSWRTVKVPGNFEAQFKELKNYDGMFWYRIGFDLPKNLQSQSGYILNLGAVDDESWVWLNGKFLGEVTQKTNPDDYWGVHRRYVLAPSDLKPTGNVLVVLCNDLRDNGGMVGRPELRSNPHHPLYADVPQSVDDPYRYYRW